MILINHTQVFCLSQSESSPEDLYHYYLGLGLNFGLKLVYHIPFHVLRVVILLGRFLSQAFAQSIE